MGEEIISIVCSADDLILISESEVDLQRLLYQFNLRERKCNMIISTNKTKSMVNLQQSNDMQTGSGLQNNPARR